MTRLAASRRRLLGALAAGAAGLSGCVDGDTEAGAGADDGDAPADGGESDSTSGTDDGASDDGTADDGGTTEDGSTDDGGTSELSRAGTWPSAHYGPANTGTLPGASAPTELSEHWRAELPGSVVGGPAILEDLLVVATGHSEGVVVALDRETGEQVWRAWTSSDIYSEPVVADGTAYVGDISGRLNAIDVAAPPEDEAPELIKVEFPFSGAPAAADGALYFGDDDGVAYGFDPADGSVLWTTETAGNIRTPATVVDGAVYLGNGGNELVALETADGSERWRVTGEATIGASPTVADGTVYAADFDGVVHAVDAADGATEWTATLDDTVREAVAVAGGAAYVVDDSGTVTALELDDGSERWRHDAGEDAFAYGLAATADVVVTHVGDDTVLALDAGTGEVRGKFVADDSLWERPTVGDGVVYVGAGQHLYAIGE